jgi:hypothetical protein
LSVSVPIFKKVEWYEIIEYVRPEAEPERGRITGRDREPETESQRQRARDREPELGPERESVKREI